MRLIDADELMSNAEYKGKHDILTAYDVVAAPTIDAVPVIRCADCVHRDTRYEWHGDYNCRLHHEPKSLGFYCADGKRREDGENDEVN